jgi:PKD repeat protein
MLLIAMVVGACNLRAAPETEEDIEQTARATGQAFATRTPGGVPTGRPVTQLPAPTQRPISTAISARPILLPTATGLPLSIYIQSPAPGNVVAGTVQIVGAASHPNFLQYQVEFGPMDNPNLWYPAVRGVVRTPVAAPSVLDVWDTRTSNSPDGLYQLRLRVFLRDGSELRTLVSNVRVQNIPPAAPTAQPTATSSVPRPIAAFTQDRASGNAPLVVRFTNLSSGQITATSWNFGDGSGSNEPNPTHTFATPGSYIVTLTVSGPGGSANVSSQVIVQSANPPAAAFSASPLTGPAPLDVTFTNQSRGEITSYEWLFGDGTSSTQRDVTHRYTTVGTYTVILRVAGPGGASTATTQVTVSNPQVPPPVASFLPDTPIEADAPVTVQFESTSTGDIDAYFWDFGDGQNSILQNPLHTFAEPGEYTVRLTVSGDGGQDTAEITVSAVAPEDAPEASFEIEGESSGRAPFTATFRNTSQGEVDSVLWDFGDGTTSDRAEDTITHEYTGPGTYTVTLTVGNGDLFDTATGTITALPALVPPNAQFAASPISGPAPLLVTFTNQSAGDNLTYAWDIGDGTTSDTSAPSFTHEFAEAGRYTVELTVTNEDEDLSDSFALEIIVSEEVGEVTELTGDFTIIPVSETRFEFSATASGGTPPYTFNWNFGNGQTGSGQNAMTAYAQPGDYTVALTITDAAGDTFTVEKLLTAAAPPQSLSADFVVNEAAPLQFDFDANASGGSGSYTFAWDFGDGTTGTGEATAHTYAADGAYTVTLTVTDSAGASISVAQDITASPAPVPLTADFTFSESTPLTIDFTATAAGGTAPYSFTWDFGDGSQGTGETVSHTYTEANTYGVQLTVTDAVGETVTVNREVTPTAPAAPLTVDFSAAPTGPLSFDFSAAASGGSSPYTFTWDFGDGTSETGELVSHTYAAPGSYTVTVTATDSTGITATDSDVVTIELTPLAVSFEAFPAAAPLTIDFTGSVQGGTGPYTFSWDFGDGTSDTGETISHTYATDGTYNVILTVTDGAGQSGNATQQVAVAPVADPLSITFIFVESVPGTFDFTATPAGGTPPYTVTWDFGDSTTSAGETTSHTFTPGQDYVVTATVTDSAGQTASSEPQTITPTEEEEDSLAATTPILPENLDELRAALRPIFESGAALGNRQNVFAVVGDQTAELSTFLDPFAASGTYVVDPSAAELQDTITQYATDNGDGIVSFSRDSIAAADGLNAADLLRPGTDFSADCAAGETLIACELRITRPAIVLINIGYHDVTDMTGVDEFTANLDTIVQEAINAGVIPVLATVIPVAGDDTVRAQTDAINNAIITVADDNDVPLFNQWRALNELPSSGLGGDNLPSVAPEGAGFISANPQYGANARNTYFLSLLRAINSTIFQ